MPLLSPKRSKLRRAMELTLVPLVSVGVTIILRHVLAEAVGDAPFLLLLASVTLSAYIGGIAPGLIATGLSLLFAAQVMDPPDTLQVDDPHDRFQLVVFMFEAVVITFLCGALRRARVRAEEEAARAGELQRQVSDAADREQTRIGQDLHDDLGQYLTGVALAGGLLTRRIEKKDPDLAREASKLVHMVNDAVNRTRQLARGLAPMTIDPDSLSLLLKELQERTGEVSGRKVTFDMTGPTPALHHETVLHLYRIAQEAVGNASKHSGASQIDIHLRNDPSGVSLTIRDNGQWKPAKTAGPGMGMRVMQFRARTIGATLHVVNGTQTTGTQVLCTLPPSALLQGDN